MNKFSVETKSAKLGFEILEDAQIVMTICNSNDLSGLSLDAKKELIITEVQVTGKNFHHRGTTFIDSNPGSELTYVKHLIFENANGKLLKIVQTDVDKSLKVTNYYQLYDDTRIIRCWVLLENMAVKFLVLVVTPMPVFYCLIPS